MARRELRRNVVFFCINIVTLVLLGTSLRIALDAGPPLFGLANRQLGMILLALTCLASAIAFLYTYFLTCHID